MTSYILFWLAKPIAALIVFGIIVLLIVLPGRRKK